MLVFWCLQLPYGETDDFSIREAVRSGERQPIPEDVPKPLAELIARCWAHEAKERPTMRRVVDELKKLPVDVAPAGSLSFSLCLSGNFLVLLLGPMIFARAQLEEESKDVNVLLLRQLRKRSQSFSGFRGRQTQSRGCETRTSVRSAVQSQRVLHFHHSPAPKRFSLSGCGATRPLH